MPLLSSGDTPAAILSSSRATSPSLAESNSVWMPKCELDGPPKKVLGGEGEEGEEAGGGEARVGVKDSRHGRIRNMRSSRKVSVST